MQQLVTLTTQEVTEAILQYATSQGIRFEGMKTEVTLVAGRGEKGVYATIELQPETRLDGSLNSKPILKKPEDGIFLQEYDKAIEELKEGNFDEIEEESNKSEPEDEEELFL